jgi:putative addiction module component (TIGR02574 family)
LTNKKTPMASYSEVAAQAMKLPVSERAQLASRLLHSLPPAKATDENDEDAEALRRDAEMDADPAMCLTFEEFKRAIGR